MKWVEHILRHLICVLLVLSFFSSFLSGFEPIGIEVNGASQSGTNQSLQKGLYRLEYISGAVKFGDGRYSSNIRLTINQQSFVPFASGEKPSVSAVEQLVAGSSFSFQLNETTIINLKYFDSGYHDNGGNMKMRIKLISQIPENLNTGQSLIIIENQDVGAIVGDFHATDPEGGDITYHFINGENNNSLFTLETNGTLKTATIFDYESNASTYTIRVQAKDELNATTEGNFTITLTDVYEDTDGDGLEDHLEQLGANQIRIRAQIDGKSRLVLKKGSIQWDHILFAKPGLHGGTNYPTTINNTIDWIPQWTGNISDEFNQVNVDLRGTVTIDPITARNSLSVVQQPTFSNEHTTIVEIYDSAGGSSFYDFTLTGNGPSGYLTDYQDADSDDDGFNDWIEVSSGSNPNDQFSNPFNHGLVAWYPFDGNASDMSGNGNHGTVHGATLGTDRHGHVNKAYNFDGMDDYIILPPVTMDSAYLNGAVSIWFRTDNPKWYLFSATGNDIRYYVKLSPEGFCSTFGNPGMSSSKYPINSEWNHGIVNWKKSTNIATLYLNGIFMEEISSIQFSGKPNQVTIGSHSPNHQPYEGSIDDIRIYNRALSAAEVLALYNLEKPKIPLTNSNFQTAVNLWFSDEANATATYGHISDWNVSAVTDMSQAFKDRTDFNEDISPWDTSNVTTTREMFYGASSFNQGIGVWNTSEVISMTRMFNNATSFNQPIGDWDVSSVTSMHRMFVGATSFNQPIGDWNVASVIDMRGIFGGATAFDQAIGGWDVSRVSDMREAFMGASSFNKPIGSWDVSSVTSMYQMFNGATSFNHPLDDWNISAVTNTRAMFKSASAFNQTIADWNISSVTSMGIMFSETNSLSDANKAVIHYAFKSNPNWSYDWSSYVGSTPLTDSNFQTAVNLWFSDEANATATYGHISDWNTSAVTNMADAFKGRATFNEDISRWNVSSVTNMSWMFRSALSFNQPLGDWNVSRVINMDHMFSAATNFNQDISQWDTSKVTNMRYLFNDAENFDQDIGDWNTSKATNMFNMFSEAKRFNQEIGNWDTSSVISKGSMFKDAISFNQDISDWNTSSVANMSNMFLRATSISNENKGLIHESFASNPNWSYDWRPFVLIDDSNFHSAIDLWFDNQAEANATYGHISDWNVSAVTDMAEAFMDRSDFNEDISNWDVSNVTTMVRIFYEASSFNQDISNWDISSVTTLNGAFRGADSFNQDIGNWNTSAVTDISYLFAGADSFNQNIGNWDISNVRSMLGTFRFTASFNQDLSTWDTSSVTRIAHAFELAQAFNQDLSDWNTSSVTDMEDIFKNTSALSDTNKGEIHKAFLSNPNWPHDWRAYVVIDDSNFHRAVDLWFDNQAEANATYGHISDWNVSAVTNMTEAFNGRSTFNEDLSRWDTSKVKKMVKMFSGCTVFNQSLAPWDLSSVTSTRQMFEDATSFNKPIGNWNVSSVETMHMMFDGADSFNQPLDDWNLSSARVLTWMFREAESFNQNIASWNVLPDVDLRGIFIRAPQFNQDISGLDISSDSNLTWMFDDTSSLSDYNKGKIHAAFSFNQTWPYDWSEFVSDTNETDPPADHNQTQPGSPDNNESATQPPAQDNNQTVPSPGDHNATQPPILDGNQTKIPPVKDSNQTTIDPPKPELIVLAPMVTTYGYQQDENGTITLYGKIRSDGNGTIEQAGFYIRTSMDGNDTVLLTENLSKDDSFSTTVSSESSFYFQAFARNEKGETTGTWKRVGATIQSYPIDGAVETGDGWSTSEWFGDFRYFENGWAYHYGLGWVYLSSDGADGIWLWREEHGWLWSNQATWPFLWNHASGDWIYLLIRKEQSPVFFDYSTGQYRR